jgi:cbb3-type cytochrome oxidase subunit 3
MTFWVSVVVIAIVFVAMVSSMWRKKKGGL